MNTPDELEQLWKTQPVDPAVKGEEMRTIILNKTAKFDRTIRRRNIRETVAAFAVAVFYFYATWVQRNGIARFSSAIIATGALYIVCYMWRGGSEPASNSLSLRDPKPDQTLAGYQRALASKIDHQIRLLRSVKYWGLLPMFVGLVIGSIGIVKEHAEKATLTWVDGIAPLLYTLVFSGVWWANEVWAVRKLERMRAKLMAGGEEIGAPC
jgi:hypothetical protein